MRYKEPFTLYPRKISSGKTVWYYRTYDEYGVRTTGKSTGETNKTRARLYCLDLLKKDQLISKKMSFFSEYAEGWFEWDTCSYVKTRRVRGTEKHPGIKKSYAADLKNRLKRDILPSFQQYKLDKITPRIIENWVIKKRDDGLAPKNINNSLSVLRIMMEEAHKNKIIPSNPAELVQPLLVERKVRRVITLDEIRELFAKENMEKLWKNNIYYYTANLLAASTGMRQGEIRGLLKNHYFGDYALVEFSYGQFGFTTTKTNERRNVPIPKRTQIYIDMLCTQPWDYIFTMKGTVPIGSSKLTESLYSALELMGITEAERKERYITFHGWRHFFNTYCRSNNIADSKLQSVTGHKTQEMVENYTNFELSDVKEITELQNSMFVD